MLLYNIQYILHIYYLYNIYILYNILSYITIALLLPQTAIEQLTGQVTCLRFHTAKVSGTDSRSTQSDSRVYVGSTILNSLCLKCSDSAHLSLCFTEHLCHPKDYTGIASGYTSKENLLSLKKCITMVERERSIHAFIPGRFYWLTSVGDFWKVSQEEE